MDSMIEHDDFDDELIVKTQIIYVGEAYRFDSHMVAKSYAVFTEHTPSLTHHFELIAEHLLQKIRVRIIPYASWNVSSKLVIVCIDPSTYIYILS